jgi:hypothetical protein
MTASRSKIPKKMPYVAVAAAYESDPEDTCDGRRQRHPGIPGFGFFLGLWLAGYRVICTRSLWRSGMCHGLYPRFMGYRYAASVW